MKHHTKFSDEELNIIYGHMGTNDHNSIFFDDCLIYKTLEAACLALANGDGYFNSVFYINESPKYKKQLCEEVLYAMDYSVYRIKDEIGFHYLLIKNDEEN